MNYFASILILTIVTIIHELGHLLVSIYYKANVKEFSIGFGPSIFSFNYKGITYKLSPILLGGYVRYDEDTESPNYFDNLKLSHQIAIAVAGPVFNIISGIMFYNIYAFIVNVSKGIYFSGIIPNFIKSINILLMSIVGVADFFINFKVDNASGPVGIVSSIGHIANENGSLVLVAMTAFISFSIGLFNLLPFIGVTDGGKIVSSTVTHYFGHKKWVSYIFFALNIVSLAALLALTLYVTKNDITKLF